MHSHDNVPCWSSGDSKVFDSCLALESIDDSFKAWIVLLDILLNKVKADRLEFELDVRCCVRSSRLQTMLQTGSSSLPQISGCGR